MSLTKRPDFTLSCVQITSSIVAVCFERYLCVYRGAALCTSCLYPLPRVSCRSHLRATAPLSQPSETLFTSIVDDLGSRFHLKFNIHTAAYILVQLSFHIRLSRQIDKHGQTVCRSSAIVCLCTMTTPLEAVAQNLRSNGSVSGNVAFSTRQATDAPSATCHVNSQQNVRAPGTAAKLASATEPSHAPSHGASSDSASAAGHGPVSSLPSVTSPPPSSTRPGLLSVLDEGVLRFLVGGLAGATAKTIIAPLDRMKIIFQISHKVFSFQGVWAELVSTARSEGLPGLFRGNGAQILRVYPYSGIQLLAFDTYAALLLKEKQAVARLAGKELPPTHGRSTASSQLSPVERMLACSAAGATSVAATYPLDCIRARLAVQQELRGETGAVRYRGIWHAMRHMAGESGVGSLYRGMAPTLLGILPYAGISFATYETLKATAAREGEVPNWKRLLFGGIAGLAGQATTYPLDIVRRRMQTDGFTPIHAHAQPSGGTRSPSPSPPSAFTRLRARGATGGMLDVLGRIMDREGARGLFKGLSMNVIKGPIAVGVSFTTYDTCKRWLGLEGGSGGHGG